MAFDRLRHFVNIQRMTMSFAGTCFGILLSVFANWIYSPERLQRFLPWLAVLTFVAVVVAVVFALRKPLPGISVKIGAPLTLRTPLDSDRYARRGLVGFVPLYNPMDGNPAKDLKPAERRAAVMNKDLDKLCLDMNSNFRPTITAIRAHAPKLEHVWLIATQGRAGSEADAEVLAEYLRRAPDLKCQVHTGRYAVHLDDDINITRKVRDNVKEIFNEAARDWGIAENEMVCDITSGIRSMPLGMILACVNEDQDIEFVGGHYDEDGKVIDEKLTPAIYQFEITSSA